jgi:DNA-binding response OmpR family regulator
MRLLFIEGDATVHRWLESQADASDLEVFCASDVTSALEVLATIRPNAVIADVGSCPLPGSAEWRKLGRVLNARFIPLLVYASSRHMGAVASRVGRRCSGMLPSPFSLARAVQRVHWVIARRRAREARQVANTRFGQPTHVPPVQARRAATLPPSA